MAKLSISDNLMPSSVGEDYLKAIYKLSREERPASTSAISEHLGVAAGSVSGMLRRLSDQGLVEHVPYYGARLTRHGQREALRIIRRHRILELFLVDVLGYTWDRVHVEAERLEHAASDELIDRLAQMMHEPESDPHGAPIPGVGLDLEELQYPTLAELAVGSPAVLRRVGDEGPEALRYLADLDLIPGVEVEVLDRAPFEGPVRLRVGKRERILGHSMSQLLQVEPKARAPRRRSTPKPSR